MIKDKRKNELFSAYKDLWKLTNGKERLLFFCLIILVLFRCFAFIAMTQVLACLVDEISGNSGNLFGFYLPDSWTLIQVVIFTHIIMILIWCISALIGNLIRRYAVRLSCKVNKKVLNILTTPRKNLDYKMTNGEAVFIANNVGESVIYLIKDLLLKIFIPIGACIIALVYISQIDILSFVAFAVCFLFILVSSFIRLRLESKYQNKLEKAKSKINNIYLNNIDNLPLITMSASQEVEEKKLQTYNQDYMHNFDKDNNMRVKYWFFAYVVQYLLIGVGIITCILRQGELVVNIANIVALVSYSQQLCSPLENVGVELGQLQLRAIQFNRMHLLCVDKKDHLVFIEKNSNNFQLPLQETIDKIEINNLFISIGEFEKKYKKIILEKGKINVICGDSGAGKSIFIGALLGIKTKEEGQIIINNKYKMNSLYNNKEKISFVSQNDMLFDRSIIENIAYPQNKLTKEMKRCVKAFKIEKIVKRDPADGSILKTLSGGEQKRISIIRGISKNADVYIFDEPTNDLDSNNVQTLINELKKLKVNRIVIIISHDKRVFNIADNIIDLSIKTKKKG